MSEMPEQTPSEDAFSNPVQPWLVLGGTAAAFAACAAIAVFTRHPLAVRGALTTGGKLATALVALPAAAAIALGTAKALEAIMPGPITGLDWRRYPSPEQ